MKLFFRLTGLLAIIISLNTGLQAQPNSKVIKPSAAIPLIDRDIFFGNPEITYGQLSPDGKFISFLKPYNGTLNIYVKKTDESFEKATRLTNMERPVSAYFWTYDGKYILYLKDKGGNENFNIYAVNPAETPDAAAGIPESRNLTPNDKVSVQIYAVSHKNPDEMTIGLNDRDAKWHDLYRLTISSGKLEKIRENTDRISGWVFDWAETPRLAIRNPEDGSTEILRVENDGKFTKIYEVGPMENAFPSAFSADNKMVYLSSNKGTNLLQLRLMDPATGKTSLVEEDPLKRVDLQDASFSDVTHQLELTTYVDDHVRLYFKNKKLQADFALLQKKFPGREINSSSTTNDEQKVLISILSDVHVPEVYLFDRVTKKTTFQYTPRPRLKAFEQYLNPMQAVHYKSSDGLDIPAFLTIPKETNGKKLPVIIFPHGGPWARDFWGFNGVAQMMSNRGFVVLSPNFRGSTGYGKQFLDAGNLQWGKLMQDDITWGVKYLVDKGIADPKRVAIMGGSYGGYATLAGLTFTPDLYAAGVDIVGPSNLFTLMASIPPYWEAGRKIFALRMGDENTEAGKKILHDASPIFSVDKIKSPLMIVQGANDPRVNKGESDQIVIALRDKKANPAYILADDEGHGFAKPVNNLGMFAAAEKFLAQYCGTRYQESMPDDVAKRLKENTVDINTVKLIVKSATAVMQTLPDFTSDLSAGEFTYAGTIQVNGQNIKVDMKRSVVQHDGNWDITDQAAAMGQQLKDMSVFIQGSLVSVKQISEQAPSKITINHQSGNIEIVSDISGKTTTKNMKADGVYIQDGPGLDMIVARFPLTAGYTTAFYAADGQAGKMKKMILKVTGNEMVGAVNTTVVSLTNDENPVEKTTFYIDMNKKAAIKIEQILPALMNAKLTMEMK